MNILLAKLASFKLYPSSKQTSTENCNRRPPMQNKFIRWPEQTLVMDFCISNKRFGQKMNEISW